MANKVGGKITGVILSVLGLAFAAGSLYFAQQSLDLFQDGITAQGSVARVESHSGTCGSGSSKHPCTKYRRLVSFTDSAGEDHEFLDKNTSNSSSAYRVGQRVEVLYMPDDPQNATINTFFSLWGVPIILGIFAAAFGLVGFLILKQAKLRQHLIENGEKILADVSAIEEIVRRRRRNSKSYSTTRTTVNYVVVAQWKDPKSGTLHSFRSDQLPYSPSHLVGKQTPVFIDRKDPTKYHFDTSAFG